MIFGNVGLSVFCFNFVSNVITQKVMNMCIQTLQLGMTLFSLGFLKT